MAAKRRHGLGDFPPGSPMAEAVDRFREQAKLIESAPDDALVRFAHDDGWDRPQAEHVRETLARERGRPIPDLRKRPTIAQDDLPAPTPAPTAGEAHVAEPGLPGDALECPHARVEPVDGDELACLSCGETIDRFDWDDGWLPEGIEGEPAPRATKLDDRALRDLCPHIWVPKGVPSSAFGFPDLIRVFDHCSLCGFPRPSCRNAAHRALVDAGALTYCATCGRVLATQFGSFDAPAHETIHHPLLTDEPVVRVEPSVGTPTFSELSEEELIAILDESERIEHPEDEEILY